MLLQPLRAVLSPTSPLTILTDKWCAKLPWQPRTSLVRARQLTSGGASKRSPFSMKMTGRSTSESRTCSRPTSWPQTSFSSSWVIGPDRPALPQMWILLAKILRGANSVAELQIHASGQPNSPKDTTDVQAQRQQMSATVSHTPLKCLKQLEMIGGHHTRTITSMTFGARRRELPTQPPRTSAPKSSAPWRDLSTLVTWSMISNSRLLLRTTRWKSWLAERSCSLIRRPMLSRPKTTN